MDADAIFKALSDQTRRDIFGRLCREGAMSVQALTEGYAITQPAVSRHLALLREAGLVSPHPAGRQTFYKAEPAALAPLTDWLRFYSGFWEQKLDGLDDLLKRMDQ